MTLVGVNVSEPNTNHYPMAADSRLRRVCSRSTRLLVRLDIRPVGYQFGANPQAAPGTDWDANWLVVRGEVQTGRRRQTGPSSTRAYHLGDPRTRLVAAGAQACA